MQQNPDNAKTSLLKSAAVFSVAFIFVVSTVLVTDWLSGKPNPSKGAQISTDRPAPTCPSDYPSYQKLSENKKSTVDLISTRTSMFAENQQFKSKIVVTKIETEKSKVACGYLFVRAGSDDKGPVQPWENLYINPNSFGGHIDAKNSIGLGDGATSTEYLFSLSKINYWRNRTERAAGNLQTADWGVLLNVSQTIGFEIGLNTNNKTGFIDKFSIAYKCWNPNTGEENQDCSIQVSDQ